MKQAVARWRWLRGSDISSWRALMQSLILAGVSPDEPDFYGTWSGHILFDRVSRFLSDNEGRCWVSWQHELINTCLEYLNSGGVLRIHGPICLPHSNTVHYLYGSGVNFGLKIVSQIISCAEFCGGCLFSEFEFLLPNILEIQISQTLICQSLWFLLFCAPKPSWRDFLKEVSIFEQDFSSIPFGQKALRRFSRQGMRLMEVLCGLP